MGKMVNTIQCLLCVLLLIASGSALAQATDPQQAPAPEAQGCFPTCRDGFVCSSGQCVSVCNPPCQAGTMCTAERQCVPSGGQVYAPSPQSAYPPAMMAYPPQPLSRRERRLAERQLRREEKAARREQQREELDAHGYRGRVYAAAHVTYQGRGLSDNPNYYSDFDSSSYDDDRKHSVGSQLGLDLGFEFRSNMVFGLGPGLRYQRITHADTDVLDLTINPTFHMSFDMLEIIFPISVGFSLAWDDHASPGDGPFDADGAGFAVGIMPGVIFWPTRTLGIYATVGLTGHLLSLGYANRFYTTASNFGVTFAY